MAVDIGSTGRGRTNEQSPDMLPAKGYSMAQLKDYILRQLGYPTWNVELTAQQVLDCIQDSLTLFSLWRPTVRVGNVQLVRGVFQYLDGVDVGQGITQVWFVEPNPVPTEIFYMET